MDQTVFLLYSSHIRTYQFTNKVSKDSHSDSATSNVMEAERIQEKVEWTEDAESLLQSNKLMLSLAAELRSVLPLFQLN